VRNANAICLIPWMSRTGSAVSPHSAFGHCTFALSGPEKNHVEFLPYGRLEVFSREAIPCRDMCERVGGPWIAGAAQLDEYPERAPFDRSFGPRNVDRIRVGVGRIDLAIRIDALITMV